MGTNMNWNCLHLATDRACLRRRPGRGNMAAPLWTALLATTWLTGCVTIATRDYSGPPRPAAEVALILSVTGATRIGGYLEPISTVAGATKFKTISFAAPPHLEIAPGTYRFSVIYHFSGYASTSVGTASLDAQLEAGHLYALYEKIDSSKNVASGYPSSFKWHPVLVDISRYDRMDCGGGCDDANELRQRATDYFRGERTAIVPTISMIEVPKP